MSSSDPGADHRFLRAALNLARRGYGTTSPNPMVGAVLVKGGAIIGRGWHKRAGEPHAEIEALHDAQRRGQDARNSTLYVTLEPCCTQGRTPPCTAAIVAAGIKRVVAGTTDPNPKHRGRAFAILKQAGVGVSPGVLARECEQLNEAFNHWIVHRTPFVTVKAAMTLDGKIATASGESKWITGEESRAYGMRLRQGADAILVGINTLLADDPSLTVRGVPSPKSQVQSPRSKAQDPSDTRQFEAGLVGGHGLRRIVLDSMARTPLSASVVGDEHAALTTIVVSRKAPKSRVAALARHVRVLVAPMTRSRPEGAELPRGVLGSKFKAQGSRLKGPPSIPPALDLAWLLQRLGAEEVTSLLVEGGGEVNASFLFQGRAHRIAFFYAPKILGGRDSCRAVAGPGAASLEETLNLMDLDWRQLGPDWLLSARVVGPV